MSTDKVCPCCGRPFEKIQDYPKVLILRVEILGVPEAIDYWSEEALRADLEARRGAIDSGLSHDLTNRVGINLTPEIASAYHSEVIQGYFKIIKGYQGGETEPGSLKPPLKPDSYFKWAYPIPETRLYLSLSEAEPEEGVRICQVMLHTRGPNFGSQGGPTLQPLGPIASIHYQGRLLSASG